MSELDGTLNQKVKLLLDVPFETLMTDVRVIDMFQEVFTFMGKPATLCRTCTTDRNFAYRKLQQYLVDGKTTI